MILRVLVITTLFCLYFLALFGCANKTENKNNKQAETNEQKCTLPPEKMPSISEFRLGTNLDELIKRFPELQISKKNSLTAIELKNPSITMANGESNPLEQLFVVDLAKHPEFKEIEKVRLTYFQEQIEQIDAYYILKPEWTTSKAFIDETAQRINFPYKLESSDNDPNVSTVVCIYSPGKYAVFLTGFKKVNDKNYAVLSLYDDATHKNMLSKQDELTENMVKNKVIGKSSNQNDNSKTPKNIDQVEIANVLVKVGQDAYVSQDRLEKYLVKTVGDTDTYTFERKTYEITYGAGEGGAFFVKSIKIVK